MSTMGEYAPGRPNLWPKNKRIEYEIFAVDALYSDILYDFLTEKKFHSEPGSVSLSSAILTKLQYYDDWIIREIDKRLLPRPLSRKSIRATGAFMVNISGLETLN